MSDYTGKRSEKKMIYLLLAVIAVLLIVAIVVIVYLASRMTSLQQASSAPQQSTSQQTRALEPAPIPKEKLKSKPVEPISSKEEPKRSAKLATDDIATIVQMVMTQMQKNQKPVAAPQPVLKPQPVATPQPAVQPELPVPSAEPEARAEPQASSDDLESVLNVLENVDADTVEEQTDNLSASTTQSMAKTHASKVPKRANDNFNKVVVADNAGDDLSQLGIEIDQLENDTSTPESGYEKVMKKEVVERQNEMRTIVVSEGDTLMSIAKKAYGDPRKYIRILQANPGIIKNPDRIFVGQVLRVPQ